METAKLRRDVCGYMTSSRQVKAVRWDWTEKKTESVLVVIKRFLAVNKDKQKQM